MSDVEIFKGKRLQAMTTGRVWDEGKNVALLERLPVTPMPLVVAGERSGEASASSDAGGANAAKESSDNRLRYTGVLCAAAVEQLMRESALYVVTSRYEPFGLAAVEAALAGCAIVASDLPSQREIWGDAAMYFPNDDASALGVILTRLAGDPELLRRFAKGCRRRALECFSAGRMVDGYVALYRELTQTAGGAQVGRALRGACVA